MSYFNLHILYIIIYIIIYIIFNLLPKNFRSFRISSFLGLRVPFKLKGAAMSRFHIVQNPASVSLGRPFPIAQFSTMERSVWKIRYKKCDGEKRVRLVLTWSGTENISYLFRISKKQPFFIPFFSNKLCILLIN